MNRNGGSDGWLTRGPAEGSELKDSKCCRNFRWNFPRISHRPDDREDIYSKRWMLKARWRSDLRDFFGVSTGLHYGTHRANGDAGIHTKKSRTRAWATARAATAKILGDKIIFIEERRGRAVALYM